VKSFTINGQMYTLGQARRIAAAARKRMKKQFNAQFQKHLPMIIYAEAQKKQGWSADCSVSVTAPEDVLKEFNERLAAEQLEEMKDELTVDERLKLAAHQGATNPVVPEEK